MAIPQIKSMEIVEIAVITNTATSPAVVRSSSFKLAGLRILTLVPINTPAIAA